MPTSQPTSAPTSQHAGVDLGPGYQVLGRLARGGSSTVYLGYAYERGEHVAIKVLSPELAGTPSVVRAFVGEHAVSRRVRRDGLIRIHGAHRSPAGLPFLVMELLVGESLQSWPGDAQPPAGAIAAIGAQLADVLAALHDAGVVHCDVKPDNVIVHDDAEGPGAWPRVTLIDLGVAQAVGTPPVDDGEAIAVGTPVFMAPEQWRGLPEPASDVYALGCVLYELATGRAPFDGTTDELRRAHVHHAPVAPSLRGASLPGALERLIARMLVKQPDLRPRAATCARVLAELAQALPAGHRAA